MTIHKINSHIQDIPENGADIFHFKFVHNKPIKSTDLVSMSWPAEWMRGDDPDLQRLFTHEKKHINEFKRQLYDEYIRDYQTKSKLSVASIDCFITFPFIGKVFLFNLTAIQIGSALVNIFIKTPLFKIVLSQYIIKTGPLEQTFYHNCYMPNWVPYFFSAIFIQTQAEQVRNDLFIW